MMTKPLTRAQRRYRRRGYTWEIALLRPLSPHVPSLIVIQKDSDSKREYRRFLLSGEVIRPVATTYLHNGRKP